MDAPDSPPADDRPGSNDPADRAARAGRGQSGPAARSGQGRDGRGASVGGGPIGSRPVGPTGPRGTVVLVHGIWMHGLAMAPMGARLRRLGHRTRRFSYDFLTKTPAENGDALAEFCRELDAEQAERAPVHLVGHSLGGIVVLHCLDRHPDLPIERVVLLGSPVRGSAVARRVHANEILRPLLGRAGERGLLGDVPEFAGRQELGIVTGSGRFGLSALLFPLDEDGDGVVGESETVIENAAERVTVSDSHSALMVSAQAAELVARFVERGRFR